MALVAALRRHGVAGASVLLGVDGTAHGRRRAARFAGASGHVPLLVVSVGAAGPIARALAELDAELGEPPRTLERVRVCKRDGERLAGPHDAPGGWVKLTVVCGEQSRHDGRPLAERSCAACAPAARPGPRRCAASGATTASTTRTATGCSSCAAACRCSSRPSTPPSAAAAAFALADRLTATDGLVLSERVPAFLASGPGVTLGGLELEPL